MSVQHLQLIATEDGSYTLYDLLLEESYHSKFGAKTESDQVFLHNTGINDRLATEKSLSVLEIGFGTGYNFVHTSQKALRSNCTLHYTALEMHPLPSDLILDLLEKNAIEKSLSQFTADALGLIAKPGSISDTSFNQQVHLQLINADANHWRFPKNQYDAIYLDAFSSKNNPLLWQPAFLANLNQSLNESGTLATYSVNRRFREALTEAGWHWRKLPGPMRKREVLIATKSAANCQT